MTPSSLATRPSAAPPPAWRLAAAGAVAVLVSVGLSELAAGLVAGVPSLVAAVGSAVIALQPPGAKEVVVALFGTNDKLALELSVVLVAVAIGALVGRATPGRPWLAPAAFAAFGLLAFGATLVDPRTSPLPAALSVAVSAWIGVRTLGVLAHPAPADEGPASRSDTPEGLRAGGGPDAEASTSRRGWSRRGFLARTGAIGLAAAAGGLAGRSLVEARLRQPARAETTIPAAARIATLPPGAEIAVAAITPLVVPNDRFYRIDTALLVPSVDVATWRLRIHGLVERETELTFEDLVALPLFEQYVTIACVSNEVGGDLVGNAKWTGVSLRDVLDIAGVRAEATQLVGRSVDGWTAGMPTSWVMDRSREPMIAVRMNDEPLPVEHGSPARLIVPGLYGYVSATKWLSELELTTLEAFDAFWIPRGWAKEAPILTQSRIDVPRPDARLAAGRVALAGVAWAPDRGIRRVEVAIDGAWHEARIANPISDATWVQWRLDWEATPGRHELRVRATDGRGEVQTDQRSEPIPDGARGHHTISVTVA